MTPSSTLKLALLALVFAPVANAACTGGTQSLPGYYFNGPPCTPAPVACDFSNGAGTWTYAIATSPSTCLVGWDYDGTCETAGTGNRGWSLTAPFTFSDSVDYSVEYDCMMTRSNNPGNTVEHTGFQKGSGCSTGLYVGVSLKASNGIGQWSASGTPPPYDSLTDICGDQHTGHVTATESFHVAYSWAYQTDTLTRNDGLCTKVTTGSTNPGTWTSFVTSFSNAVNGGTGCIDNAPNTPDAHCHSIISNLVINVNDGATFTIPCPAIEPPEFDSGLVNTVSSLGFRTPESQFFFALILVGISIVTSAGLTAMFGEGKGRTWGIYVVSALTGLFCILLSFLQLWIYVLSLVVSVVIVLNAGSFTNTFRNLLDVRRRASATPAVAREARGERLVGPKSAKPEQRQDPETSKQSEAPEEPSEPEPPEEPAPESEASPEPAPEPVVPEGSD